MEKYENFSPTDFRYGVEDLKQYLSEGAFIRYKARVESVLAEVLAEYKICSKEVAEEIKKSALSINAGDVYKEEERIKHDIRALVNIISGKVSDDAKRFIHLMATSYDIVDTANALRYKEAIENVILPDMLKLEKTWIELAKKERNTICIGRTHGQHAEPITFGFSIALYVDRFGDRIIKLKEASENLTGKFSGAVGAYNASSIFLEKPEIFEEKILKKLNLKVARISTQIVPAEPTIDLIHTIVSSFGVLANYADDMRHLQRTEISEVYEFFGEEQVGSSTMPHKKNPINFENIKSAWKEFMPRVITHYMDQISEHQRDLTNSLSQRYIPELLVMFDSSVRRAEKISRNLKVDKNAMKKNFDISKDKIIAEPLQILLSYYGFKNAHEKIRKLSMESYRTGKPLNEIVFNDPELKPYLKKFNESQIEILSKPEKYVGIAAEKTIKICNYWDKRINDLLK
ncbi:MAG: lyase family protein [Candidatus Altiarchaeota archaeon]